jgi:hypothetical protein
LNPKTAEQALQRHRMRPANAVAPIKPKAPIGMQPHEYPALNCLRAGPT